MKRSRIGHYFERSVGGEIVRTYVPPLLPPNPPIKFHDQLTKIFEQATLALGRLDGLSVLLPNVDLFIYMYVRKEALLSSQIEGTQSSLSDLLLFENSQIASFSLDIEEVSTYISATNHGLNRLKAGFPLSTRLIREIHAILMSSGRGNQHAPGEFRRSQNWLGGTRPGNAIFIPPPFEQITELMTNLEQFWHDQTVPILVRAAISHVQLETIHPFLDGNGRLGRLLITLLLCNEGILREPILYLSLYLKNKRQMYYELLQRVRLEGIWELWFEFFLNGIVETANQAIETTKFILRLFENDRNKLRNNTDLKLHQYLQKHPFISITKLAKEIGISVPTATKSVNELEKLNILHEITGKQRDRMWVYKNYLDILQQGTEPI